MWWRSIKSCADIQRAVAALVAYSRVNTGVHYPSDTIVGAVTGVALVCDAAPASRGPGGSGGARTDASPMMGLRDRAVALRRDLELDSPPDDGTRIAVTLPED